MFAIKYSNKYYIIRHFEVKQPRILRSHAIKRGILAVTIDALKCKVPFITNHCNICELKTLNSWLYR